MATPLDTLRRHIDALPSGMRRRYPDTLKRQIIDLVEQRCVGDEAAARRCIRDLGLHWLTFNRWRVELQPSNPQSATASRPATTLLPVLVTAPRHEPTVSASVSTLALHTPRGYRIDGFEHLEQLLELLARLSAEGRP